MKVTKYISVDTEVEVDIRPEDFLTSICGTADSLPTALMALNNIAGILKGISDGIIKSLNPEQRNIVFKFLIEQANRYADKTEAS